MVYNFKERFAGLIESGQKITTIRAPRKDGKLPKPGEVLKLFTGMRTKKCRKIGERVCKAIYAVELNFDGIIFKARHRHPRDVAYMDLLLLSNIARKDGFGDWIEMRGFFTQVHGLPFKGYLIEWYPL